MRLLSVIPARLGSSRIPSKPLCPLSGEPLIRLVARRVRDFQLGGALVVATDSPAVCEAVAPLGVTAVLTSGGHASGTERVAEVAAMKQFSRADLILNIQCDQPFLPREAAVGALKCVAGGADVGTAAAPLPPGGMANPNVVKVLVDRSGKAHGFSRTPPLLSWVEAGVSVLQHIGVYAYTRRALMRWIALPPSPEERSERLEQLRPMAEGFSVRISILSAPAPRAVDTEQDIVAAEAYLGVMSQGLLR